MEMDVANHPEAENLQRMSQEIESAFYKHAPADSVIGLYQTLGTWRNPSGKLVLYFSLQRGERKFGMASAFDIFQRDEILKGARLKSAYHLGEYAEQSALEAAKNTA